MSVHLQTPRERALAAWESNLDSHDPRRVSLPEARAIVAHVHALYNAPDQPVHVEELFDSQARGHISGAWASMSATRMTLYRPCNTLTILHELAHHYTEDPLARLELRRPREAECHGNLFLALYVDMLDRLMGPRYNKGYLMSTLQPLAKHGVAPAWAPRPWWQA